MITKLYNMMFAFLASFGFLSSNASAKVVNINTKPKKVLGYVMAFAMLLFNINVSAQCTNLSQYGSATANAFGSVTISTCNYLTEYSPIYSVTANTSYTLTLSGINANPGYITVYEGSATGTLVDHGAAPLTWTSNAAGTYYVHWNVDSLCATATGCHTTTITGNAIPVLGCTDPIAINYDSLATQDDGSCIYVLGCTDPLATNYDSLATQDDGSCLFACIAADTLEDFEGTTTGRWFNNLSSNNVGFNSLAPELKGWRINSGGTSSGSTGPTSAFQGVQYVYVETSGSQVGQTAEISLCVDLSNWAIPGMYWNYHMYGAGMGTLDVDVSTNAGLTWTNEWSLSGDQGNFWQSAFVNLSTYSGVVDVRFRLTIDAAPAGAFTFQSDAALDNVGFSELTLGCTDPFADNYDPLASIDDGSCLYTGCLDQYASNYCASCNVNDASLCTYYPCNTLNYIENLESNSLVTAGYTTTNGNEVDGLTFSSSADALIDTVSLQFTGGDNFYTTQTSATAFTDNPERQAYANFCLDLSGSGSEVDLKFSAGLKSAVANRAWFRVLVNGIIQTESISGIDHFSDANQLSGFTSSNANANEYGEYLYELDAFAGQSNVYVTFQAMVNHNLTYSTFSPGYVWIDDIEAYEVTPCTYYEIQELFSFDNDCNGDNNGNAMVLANNSQSVSGDIYTWLTSTGSIYATTQQVTNLVAGTYTVTATDPDNGCNDAIQVTITEPTPVTVDTASTFIVNTPTVNDSVGLIDITAAGGTPCVTAAALITHNPLLSSNGSQGVHFNITNTSGVDITITDFAQGAYSAFYAGTNDITVYSMPAPYNHTTSGGSWSQVGQSLVTIPAGGGFLTPVYSTKVVLTSPVIIPAGATYGFYVGGTSTVSYATATNAGPVGSSVASDAYISVSSGHGGVFGSGTFSPRSPVVEVGYGQPGASAYTFAWSNGATTEDISGLGVGAYTVTITDCNGCVGSETFFITAAVDPGCTDPLANNYDPSANLDDGSCQYLGCTDSLATNYVIGSNVDDGSCIYNCAYYGYDGDLVIDMHDSFGDGWNGAVLYITNALGDTINTGGSTIVTGLEFDDSLCVYNGCYEVNVTSGSWNGEVSWEILLDGDTLLAVAAPGAPGTWTFEVGTGACNLGCTDSTAQNFDPTAVTDNGSCMYTCADNVVLLNMSATGGGWGGSQFTLYDGSGNLVVSTTYGGIFGAWDTLCLADGCYNLVVSSGSNNAGVSWSLSDGSGSVFLVGGAPYADTLCLPAVPGCTDMNACNYDPLVTTNDGSCDYSCVGCTDPVALNYSGTSFTIDDGSCFYCSITTSAVILDATANGAANGAIDYSVSGSYCPGTFCEDFESYNSGDPIAETSPNWNSWAELTTGATAPFVDDAPVTNSYANTGSNSLAFNANPLVAGPEDVILPLSNTGYPTPYVSGVATLTHNLYITSGGYYNFQAENTPGITWALEVYFLSTGQATFSNLTAGNLLTTTYPTNQWFEHKVVVDLDNNNWEVFHDGVSQGSFTNPINQIASVDYFPPAGNEFYVDDICIEYSAPLGSQANPLNAYTFAWSNGATTEDISNLNPGIYTVAVTDCQGCTANDTFTVLANPVFGCTNPIATNFNPIANVDDGSCIIPVNGCTDPLAVNYNPLANIDDGSCLVCVGSITAPWTENFDSYTSGSTDFSGNGWYNDSLTDNWEWTVDANGTTSFGTGPGNDITGGGNYIYTETSGAGSNKTANANSVCVNTTNLTTPNIRFSYHMFGTTMGTLELVIDDVVAWSQSGNLGDQWLQAQVPLPSDTNVLIQFRGLTGTSFTSDMALDELIVDDGLPAGCTDTAASNYNVFALIDDGSCIFLGCTDPLAGNFSATANTDDGSCEFYGCLDSNAINYDATATLDPNNECCYDNYIQIEMFDSFGDGWNGSVMTITDNISGNVEFSGTVSSGYFAEYFLCLANGCYTIDVTSNFWNNEVSWTISDPTSGTTILNVAVPGSPGTWQLEMGANACVVGCTDPTALNYDPTAATDDGSCIYPCALNLVYTSMLTDIDQAECSFQILDDSAQVVYASSALSGSGSTLVTDSVCLPDGCYTLTLLDAGNDGWVTGNLGSVTLTDGAGATLAYGQMFFGSSVSFSFSAGVCQAAIFGCTDSTSSNWDPLANVDDGTCCLDGCIDPLAFNFDSLATCDDGSCIPFVYGCTDAAAINYYPGANTDDGTCIYVGCTDPTAANYNPLATINDGSCTYFSCSTPIPTGVAVNWTTDTKAEITWDNMNVSTCLVDKYFVRYRVDNLDGTYGPWVTKSGGAGNGLCNFGLNTTVKRLQFLTSATTYQVKVKAFYCGNTNSAYSSPVSFTTGDDCPPMTNLTVATFNNNYAKARFNWDSTGAYVFARVALRVDTAGATWQTAGGFGVNYPSLQVNKFGLQQGESYRAQGRTFCDANITSYRSTWTSPIFWTQPGLLPIRGEGGTTINNLDVYPNPSRDIFNVTFVAEDIQNLEIRVINVVGEVVYTEALEQFVGEYTKQIDLTDNSKGVYFLEITTNSGVVNKKLIIQ